MKEKKIIKKKKVPIIPSCEEEAINNLGRIGQLEREIEQIHLKFDEDIEKRKNQVFSETDPLGKEINDLFEGLYIFAQAHRDHLIKGEVKTIQWPTGDIGWRFNPPSVKFDKEQEQKIIRICQKLHLKEFVRWPPPEINKEAMLEKREKSEKIPGITIGQDEFFFAKPAEFKERTKKLKKEGRK